MDADSSTRFTEVGYPDEPARAEAIRCFGGKFGAFGRIGTVGAWLAACQGSAPARPLNRPRMVLFAADHGIAAHGVSARAATATAELFRAFQDGTAPECALLGAAGATSRVVDMAIDHSEPSEFSVGHGSGAINIEDALTEQQTNTAIQIGADIADAEIDAGADLLATAGLGVGGSTVAGTLVAAVTGAEPVAVIGRGSGIDDKAWMRKAAATRDALRRARPAGNQPDILLRICGGADFAAMAGFLAQAAVRRIPVLLDGLSAGAAALIAEGLAPGTRRWLLPAQRNTEPAFELILDHLDLEPIVALGLRADRGLGVSLALPVLAAATTIGATSS